VPVADSGPAPPQELKPKAKAVQAGGQSKPDAARSEAKVPFAELHTPAFLPAL